MRQLDVAVDGPALLELQRAAHAVEAELPGDDRIPPLRESLAELAKRGADVARGRPRRDARQVLPGLWVTRYVRG